METTRRIVLAAIIIIAVAVTAGGAAATPVFEVSFGSTVIGTLESVQSGAPVTLPGGGGHSTFVGGGGFGNALFTAAGFAGRGRLGGDGISSTIGTNGIEDSTHNVIVSRFSIDDLVFSGPGSSVTTSVNIRVDGTFELSDDELAGARLKVAVGLFGEIFQGIFPFGNTGIGGDPAGPNGLFTGVPSGLSIHGDFTTPVKTVPTGQPGPFEVALQLDLRAGNPPDGGEAFAAGDFSHTVSLPFTGPVFDLPLGFTANAPSVLIVDNLWTGAPQAVPEPGAWALLGSGLAALVGARLRRRIMS